MNGTRAGYREWMRIRLGIMTPRGRWLLDQDLEAESGESPDPNAPPPPPLGAQPSWDLTVTNQSLNSCIESACDTILVECMVKNAAVWTDLPVSASASTSLGPLLLNMQEFPGFTDRGVINLRRSWWFDGQSYSLITPFQVGQWDTQRNDYLNVAPGTPTWIATEGDLVYLLPAPASAGTLRMTIGSGVLAPLVDNAGYDGLPAAYDNEINYVALVELASILTSNQEMVQRAQAFAPRAGKAITQLTNFFDNANNPEFIGGATFSTPVIRFSRRN